MKVPEITSSSITLNFDSVMSLLEYYKNHCPSICDCCKRNDECDMKNAVECTKHNDNQWIWTGEVLDEYI